MVREIKIRYVGKHSHLGVNKIFLKNFTLADIEDCDDITDKFCLEVDPCTCSLNEAQSYCECGSILDYGDFEIISKDLFTGLKDKNGVEIYEGDVCLVVTNGSCYQDSERRVIAFNDGRFNAGHGAIESACKFEVIGNTHQNPEPLNE